MPQSLAPAPSFRPLLTLTSLSGGAFYFAAVFAPLPDRVGIALAFLMGPFLGLALWSGAKVLQEKRPSALLEAAGLVGLAAGCVNLCMLAVQQGMFMATKPRADSQETPDLVSAGKLATRAVNDAQLSLDVAWDTLLCLSVAMMCLAALRRGTIAAVWCALGLVISIGGWIMQIATFPTPPGDAGLFDFGPFFAIWMMLAWVALAVSWRRSARSPALAA